MFEDTRTRHTPYAMRGTTQNSETFDWAGENQSFSKTVVLTKFVYPSSDYVFASHRGIEIVKFLTGWEIRPVLKSRGV